MTIGNDIVDLLDRDSAERANQSRFDARVFAPEERERIASSPAPQSERWCLWAAKEAAYKAGRRVDRGLVFSPRRFRVSQRFDRVCHEESEFDLEVDEGANLVHAIAIRSRDKGEQRGEILSRLVRLGAGEAGDPRRASARLRDFCRAEVAGKLAIEADALRIETRERIPELRLPNGDGLALSLSHHGRWAAFACALPAPVSGDRAGEELP